MLTIHAVMVARVRMVSTVIPVSAREDTLEITVKQVNCCSSAGFTTFFSSFIVLAFASYSGLHIDFFSYYFTDIYYCINHTCQNGASCVDGLHNYSCKCPIGYTGSHCEAGRFVCFLLFVVILFSFLNLNYLITIMLAYR